MPQASPRDGSPGAQTVSASTCFVTTHPIQYLSPWYRALAEVPGVNPHVIYLREPDASEQGVGFGVSFSWDVPLRSGFPSTVLGVGRGLRAIVPTILALWRELRRRAPRAVLITGWNEPGLIAAHFVARLLHIPVLVRGESNLLRHRRRHVRGLLRLFLRGVTGALAIGARNRDFYLALGVPARRIFDGAYFVESDRLLAMAAQHQADRASLRAAAGFRDGDFVFAFVGKHVAFKRPGMLIEAAALLRKRGLPVGVSLAGAGTLTDALKSRALELSVPAHFPGFLNQTELWRAYVLADAFVLPSTNAETWGLVVNEAMLFGLPVIVSDQAGCCADLVREGETGFSFSGGADALAAAMGKLVVDRTAAARMGAQGRELVREHYSMPRATAGLKAALESLA